MTVIEALVNWYGDGRVAGVTMANIFAGTGAQLPTTAGKFLTIAETGGRTPWGTHDLGFTAYRRPSFQLVAHADKYLDAANVAEAAYVVSNLKNAVIGPFFFLSLKPIQEPFSLPLGSTGKNRVAFNIETERRG